MSDYRNMTRMKHGAARCLVILVLCTGARVYGETHEVIYQGKNTFSTQRYYSALKQKKKTATPRRAAKLPTGQPLTIEGRLPITPARLTRAAPSVIEVDQLLTPMFVMGSDVQSIDWLRTNGDTFRALGAIGIVAELRGMAAWRAIQTLGQRYGLRLYVLNGDAIAEAFDVVHYPVLIRGVRHGG